MTPLRKRMLEELQRRNYAQVTIDHYIQIVEDFAKHFGRRPDQLGARQLREYQVHLFRDRKLSSRTVRQHVAALRFFFVKMLKRPYMIEHIPFPKETRRLPEILTPEEVGALDRRRKQPVSSRHADDPLRNGNAANRVGAAEGSRYR
jgi:integrase/recombinase XerD